MDKEDVVYIYTMKYYSAIKKERNFATWQQHGWTWEGVMLSEISQTEKDKYYMI